MKICYSLLGTYYVMWSNELTDEPFPYVGSNSFQVNKFGKPLTVGGIEIMLRVEWEEQKQKSK